MKYLLDASAFCPLAERQKHAYKILKESAVLDLTLYKIYESLFGFSYTNATTAESSS